MPKNKLFFAALIFFNISSKNSLDPRFEDAPKTIWVYIEQVLRAISPSHKASGLASGDPRLIELVKYALSKNGVRSNIWPSISADLGFNTDSGKHTLAAITDMANNSIRLNEHLIYRSFGSLLYTGLHESAHCKNHDLRFSRHRARIVLPLAATLAISGLYLQVCGIREESYIYSIGGTALSCAGIGILLEGSTDLEKNKSLFFYERRADLSALKNCHCPDCLCEIGKSFIYKTKEEESNGLGYISSETCLAWKEKLEKEGKLEKCPFHMRYPRGTSLEDVPVEEFMQIINELRDKDLK